MLFYLIETSHALTYLAVALLVFAGSSGPKFPRLLLSLLWLPVALAFVLFLVISLSVLWADNWVSFGPARRALGRLARLLGYFRRSGGLS